VVAVLLASIILLMIAGCLRNSIRAWEAVQDRVSVNYNRRSVLELVKRQTSSLFFKQDVDEITQLGTVANIRNRREIQKRAAAGDKAGANAVTPGDDQATVFELPEGAYFFKGDTKEISFLSTISFLSDFPGQVAVRYYLAESGQDDESPPEAADDEGSDADAGLYLYLEEKNLFLSTTVGDDEPETDPIDPDAIPDVPVNAATGSDSAFSTGDFGQVKATRTMKLLGPLREFSIQYRKPGVTEVSDAGGEDDWAESWDVEEEGAYPSAVEFILFYETPGSADLPTEDLDGIRMVIPVYDTRNLARGGKNVPF